MHSGHRHRRARGRRRRADGWEVRAPVARFVEPAALIALRDAPGHGYELADDIGLLLGVARVDYGNLYRMLRRMEEEGLVASTWDAAREGRSKRTYELTDEGLDLLRAWVAALERTRDRIGAVLDRYHERNRE